MKKIAKVLMWIPGLFWIYPLFVIPELSWKEGMQNRYTVHAVYSGLQIYAYLEWLLFSNWRML